MPALKVLLDDALIATVCTDGYDVLTVQVSGTLVDTEPATLDISAGSYPTAGESTYLVWASEIPLKHGQVVTVIFLESATTSQVGKTIDELFPDEEPVTQTDFTWTEDMFAEIRALQKVRNCAKFRLGISSGNSVFGETRPGDHGFSFGTLWDSTRTEEALISLHSYSLEELKERAPGNYLVKERMQFEDTVEFELLPSATI